MAFIARSNVPASDNPYTRRNQAQWVAKQLNDLRQAGTPPTVTTEQILAETDKAIFRPEGK